MFNEIYNHFYQIFGLIVIFSLYTASPFVAFNSVVRMRHAMGTEERVVKLVMSVLFGGFFIGTNLYALTMCLSHIH
jgi:hypothetical protein